MIESIHLELEVMNARLDGVPDEEMPNFSARLQVLTDQLCNELRRRSADALLEERAGLN